ncbi:MAG: hypothetical protein AAF197_09260 [Pseudomonadota bacterium]
MKVTMAFLCAVFIGAGAGWFAALDYRTEALARVIWDQCPQLIADPYNPERALLQTGPNSYAPIRPRARK